MKKYTWQDVCNFKRDAYACVYCPSGDYSEIKSFGHNYYFGSDCIFSEKCSFGNDCFFGEYCKFGMGCIFLSGCIFSAGCSFRIECKFGNGCVFGSQCDFYDDCNFGSRCSFGNDCIFLHGCSFGEECIFGDDCGCSAACICEFGEFTKFAKVDNFGSEGRATYFFNIVDKGIYVRCGCFAGSLEEFREKVKERHRETKLAKEYLMIADLMEYHFSEW